MCALAVLPRGWPHVAGERKEGGEKKAREGASTVASEPSLLLLSGRRAFSSLFCRSVRDAARRRSQRERDCTPGQCCRCTEERDRKGGEHAGTLLVAFVILLPVSRHSRSFAFLAAAGMQSRADCCSLSRVCVPQGVGQSRACEERPGGERASVVVPLLDLAVGVVPPPASHCSLLACMVSAAGPLACFMANGAARGAVVCVVAAHSGLVLVLSMLWTTT